LRAALCQAVSVLWNCLAYFNSCVNPIIYNRTPTDSCDERVCPHAHLRSNHTSKLHAIIYNRTSKEFRDAFLEVCRCGRGAGRSELEVCRCGRGAGRSELEVCRCGRAASLGQSEWTQLRTRSVMQVTIDERRHASCISALHSPSPALSLHSPSRLSLSPDAAAVRETPSPVASTTHLSPLPHRCLRATKSELTLPATRNSRLNSQQRNR